MAIGNMFKNFQDEDELNPVTGLPFEKPSDPLSGLATAYGMKPADDGEFDADAYNSVIPKSPDTPPTEDVLGPAGQAPQAAPQEMNPMVREYLKKNMDMGKYTDENRQKLVDESQVGMGEGVFAALAALGAGFQGKDAGAAGMASLNSMKSGKERKLSEFDKGRSNRIQDIDLERKEKTYQQDQEKLAREMDPNSAESKIAQELAISMGMSEDQAKGLTAAKFKDFSPALQKKYEIEQRKLDRQESRQARSDAKQVQLEEKQQKLQTPYGTANTEDDAKKLKEAHESKQSFDSKIQEMIDLRKKYGGEVFNREAVARGKQLSKDLLLEYKNMAKLGVLSKSDEDIINAIIPEDPLAFQGASLIGQDPILHKLESFKRDSDKDFATRVATRTREGTSNYQSGKSPDDSSKSSGYPKQVKKDGKVATVSNAEEEKEANDDGWK